MSYFLAKYSLGDSPGEYVEARPSMEKHWAFVMFGFSCISAKWTRALLVAVFEAGIDAGMLCLMLHHSLQVFW